MNYRKHVLFFWSLFLVNNSLNFFHFVKTHWASAWTHRRTGQLDLAQWVEQKVQITYSSVLELNIPRSSTWTKGFPETTALIPSAGAGSSQPRCPASPRVAQPMLPCSSPRQSVSMPARALENMGLWQHLEMSVWARRPDTADLIYAGLAYIWVHPRKNWSSVTLFGQYLFAAIPVSTFIP